MNQPSVLEDHAQYRVEATPAHDTVRFDWKPVTALSAEDFRNGIVALANYCRAHKPRYAVIDARALDPTSPAVAWLRSLDSAPPGESYEAWWVRVVVPIYHEAGIAALSVATGDPNAPGEVGTPPGVDFKVGYFPDLDAAFAWRV